MPAVLHTSSLLTGLGLAALLLCAVLLCTLRWPQGPTRDALRALLLSSLLLPAALLAWHFEIAGHAPRTLAPALLMLLVAEAWHALRLLGNGTRSRPWWPYPLAVAIALVDFAWPSILFQTVAYLLVGLACVPAAARVARLAGSGVRPAARGLQALWLLLGAAALYEAFLRGHGVHLEPQLPWLHALGLLGMAALALALPPAFALLLAERFKWRLHETSLSDAATGLPNRRALLQALERALVTARRRHAPLAVLVLEFESDSLGGEDHGSALRAVGDRINALLRGEDTLARIAKFRFGLLLAGCSEQQAREVISRIRAALEKVNTPARMHEGLVLSWAGEGTPALVLEAAERVLDGPQRRAADSGEPVEQV
jgi:diguanylate cyclase (GGDEF)-like protein